MLSISDFKSKLLEFKAETNNNYCQSTIYCNFYNVRTIFELLCSNSKIFILTDSTLFANFVRLVTKTPIVPTTFDFSGIAGDFFFKCEKNQHKVLVCGGTVQEVTIAYDLIMSKFPNLRLTTVNGYCDDEQLEDVIVNEKPTFVILSTGGKKQIIQNIKYTHMGYTCHCAGAFISQIAKGKLDYYPRIFIRIPYGRFIYRCFREPHVISRATLGYSVGFLWLLKKILYTSFLR